jgi:hypothetical protein
MKGLFETEKEGGFGEACREKSRSEQVGHRISAED